MTVTKDDIQKSILKTELNGKIVCIHSSLRSFGEVQGGADAVIEAFLEERCTVLVPSFSYDYYIPRVEVIAQNGIDYNEEPFEPNGKIYNVETADISSDMGSIPRAIVNKAGRYRGCHPTNSFSAIGPKAESLISCQTPENVYAPFQKMMEMDGYIIMMGVGLTKMTAIHHAEKLSGRELFICWALDEKGNTIRIREGSCSEGFGKLDFAVEKYEKQITVGNSLWRIFPIKETVLACAEAIKKDPSITHCDDVNCIRCNDMQKGGPILDK